MALRSTASRAKRVRQRQRSRPDAAGQPAARVLLDSDRPAAACRARPHCRFVLQLIHIIPHSLI
jgi:hypothetical protein